MNNKSMNEDPLLKNKIENTAKGIFVQYFQDHPEKLDSLFETVVNELTSEFQCTKEELFSKDVVPRFVNKVMQEMNRGDDETRQKFELFLKPVVSACLRADSTISNEFEKLSNIANDPKEKASEFSTTIKEEYDKGTMPGYKNANKQFKT